MRRRRSQESRCPAPRSLQFLGRARHPSHRLAESRLQSRPAPDQEGRASCSVDVKINCAVDGGRCKRKRLLKVLFLKTWIILKQIRAIGICRQDFQHPPDCNPHPADTGLTAHFAGINCYPVKWRLEVHETIMTCEV